MEKQNMKSEVFSKNKKFGHTRVQWLVAVIASMNMMAYGLETGWISPFTKVLQSDQSPTGRPLSDLEMSWVGSCLPLAAVCGVSLYAYIADAYGRKIGILAVAMMQVMSWLIKLSATSTTTLIISRVVAGLPSGGCFNVIPIYVREISQDDIRGSCVAIVLFMQNLGLLIMYAMAYLDYYVVIYIALSITIFTTVACFFVPESPAFLVKKEKLEEAAKAVALLRGYDEKDKAVENEVNTMSNNEQYYKSLPKITFLSIFKNKAWRRGLIIALVVISAQSNNGNFAIMTYAWTILSSTGVKMDPNLQSLVVPTVMIFGSTVAIVCVEKFGRKPLSVITYLLTVLAMACMGAVLLLHTYGIDVPGWVPMAAVALSVWAYSAGIVPAFYVVLSEIFNFQVRAKLISCIVSYGWFCSSTQLVIFTPISEMFGLHTMFFIYVGINLFGCVAFLVLMPETRGKTVEEIEAILG